MNNIVYDYLIVGSGLTGTLAAEELLLQGKSVLMLDIADQLSTDATDLMHKVSKLSSIDVTTATLEKIRHHQSRLKKKDKAWFGDQILTRWKHHFSYNFQGCAEIGPSTLFGGYSRVWGASCLPRRLLESLVSDISDQESCELINKVYDYLGVKDFSQLSLASEGRVLANRESVVSRFADRFTMESREEACRDWNVSDSLIATSKVSSSCIGCGNCLLGCPVDLILCVSDRLKKLKQHAGFHFVGKHKCLSVSETASVATAHCVDLNSPMENHLITFSSKRVLLSAGPLATTEILTNSRQGTSVLKMLTSQLFSFPIFSKSLIDLTTATQAGSFGLSEGYLYKKTNLRSSVFLQLYSCNQALRYYGSENKITETILNNQYVGKLLDRVLIACQGYLDSNDSPSLIFKNLGSGSVVELMGDGVVSRNIEKNIVSMLHACGYIAGKLKFHPVGEGYHFGGSYPFNGKDYVFASDGLGRPKGSLRIHAIDATVLPFIPAGPFTTFSLWSTLRIVKDILRENTV